MPATTYRICAALLLTDLVLHAGAAGAQNYPVKPVRIIVPFGTGGSTDAVFRILGPSLSEGLGQQVVVDNRPGAAGSIGIGLVAKSPADGYTLGVATLAYVANPFVLAKLPYDTEKDLAPVSLVTLVPLVLTVHPSVPARTVKEFIALAKSRPGYLNYASAGNASANSLAAEQFKYLAGINVTHVPYKSAGAAVVSLLGGETVAMVATLPSVIEQFKTGRLIALGVSTLKRDPTLPDVPTIDEAGVPGYEVFEWQGVVVPAGTPVAIINRLRQEIVKSLALADTKARIAGVGAREVGSTPEELARHIKKELAIWERVVKLAGIRAD
jgi:tripartite-type tricarboxylate transporter receptor subunit TctC